MHFEDRGDDAAASAPEMMQTTNEIDENGSPVPAAISVPTDDESNVVENKNDGRIMENPDKDENENDDNDNGALVDDSSTSRVAVNAIPAVLVMIMIIAVVLVAFFRRKQQTKQMRQEPVPTLFIDDDYNSRDSHHVVVEGIILHPSPQDHKLDASSSSFTCAMIISAAVVAVIIFKSGYNKHAIILTHTHIIAYPFFSSIDTQLSL